MIRGSRDAMLHPLRDSGNRKPADTGVEQRQLADYNTALDISLEGGQGS